LWGWYFCAYFLTAGIDKIKQRVYYMDMLATANLKTEVCFMSTAIIVAVLLGVCILSVKSYAKRLSHGCCGGGDSDAPKKVKVADKNKKDYPYCVTVEVDGMTCNHCKARVENALNSCNGVWAEVNEGAVIQ
jgi:hypothetical protein